MRAGSDSIENTEDVIDSRDVEARIAYLIEEEEAGTSNDDERAERKALEALREEASGCADWHHGEALVRDSYFEQYARELAEDIGAIPKDAPWPARCIDWEQAVRELQQDYTSANFDGVTYWVRS